MLVHIDLDGVCKGVGGVRTLLVGLFHVDVTKTTSRKLFWVGFVAEKNLNLAIQYLIGTALPLLPLVLVYFLSLKLIFFFEILIQVLLC